MPRAGPSETGATGGPGGPAGPGPGGFGDPGDPAPGRLGPGGSGGFGDPADPGKTGRPGRPGRPGRLAVVVGTGTGVGKTWVAVTALRRLRAGTAKPRVAARKPVQSFAACDIGTDADVLAAATGETSAEVCPPHRWYAMAMAPPMAAAFLGRPAFTLSDILAEITWPDGIDVGVVETVGGPRSPLASDADSAALTAALEPDLVVLVAPAGLGAVNAVRLSCEALSGIAAPLVVLLNRYDGSDLHDRNLRWLQRDGYEVVMRTDDLGLWEATPTV